MTAATSSAAMGCISTGGSRTVCPSVAAVWQDDLVRQLLKATGDARTVITDSKALYPDCRFGAAIPSSSRTKLVCGQRAEVRVLDITQTSMKAYIRIPSHGKQGRMHPLGLRGAFRSMRNL
jgi:hypothetical protein